MMPDIIELQLRGKGKKTKQPPIKLGPINVSFQMTYDGFLSEISALAKTRSELLVHDQIEWKFCSPASSKPLPLTSEGGYEAMKTQLQSPARAKKHDAIILVKMPQPRKDPTVLVNLIFIHESVISNCITHIAME